MNDQADGQSVIIQPSLQATVSVISSCLKLQIFFIILLLVRMMQLHVIFLNASINELLFYLIILYCEFSTCAPFIFLFRFLFVPAPIFILFRKMHWPQCFMSSL